MQPEVLERRQQLPLQRLPQAQLHGGAAVEPPPDVAAVGPFGRRGEPEQYARTQALQQPGVRRRFRVVELVDDHHVERLAGRSPAGAATGWRRRRAPARRHLAADQRLAEAAVAHDLPERRQALPQDLLLVRDEEQRVDLPGAVQPPVVQRGDDRLAGAGRHHHQVAVPAVHLPLGVQVGQDLRLVRVRPHVQVGDLRSASPRAAPRCSAWRSRSASLPGVVRLERRVVPVVLERGGERVDDVRLLDVREPDVPLHPVDQRGLRQVRRPDVRGGQCRCRGGTATPWRAGGWSGSRRRP